MQIAQDSGCQNHSYLGKRTLELSASILHFQKSADVGLDGGQPETKRAICPFKDLKPNKRGLRHTRDYGLESVCPFHVMSILSLFYCPQWQTSPLISITLIHISPNILPPYYNRGYCKYLHIQTFLNALENCHLHTVNTAYYFYSIYLFHIFFMNLWMPEENVVLIIDMLHRVNSIYYNTFSQ